MARCEQGYLCDVCGDEVHDITESDLYLRFVTGAIDSTALLSASDEKAIAREHWAAGTQISIAGSERRRVDRCVRAGQLQAGP